MQGDTVWQFHAYPITPIHIGDGSVVAAEEWRLSGNGNWLERFDPAAVLRAAPPERRRQYLEALDQGRLQDAQRLLRTVVPDGLVLSRIAVGAAAAGELREVIDNPLRRGDVRPFVRTGGCPFLPGSSIKGALRTALLSSLVPKWKADIQQVKESRRKPNRSILSHASNEIQALLLTRPETDRDRRQVNPDLDPFRFVDVGDLLLPEAATRIERVINWRPSRLTRNGKQPAEKMQMIFEVTQCAAFGERLPLPCTIRVRAGFLQTVRERDRSRRKVPSFPLDAEALARAVNTFHWRLWDYELSRFFEDEPEIKRALEALPRVKAPDGKVLGPDELRNRTDILLLRVGRFGQFESKSLEGVREGWNAQAKPPRPMTEGNTRNLVKSGGRAPLLPLGWLLMVPEGFELVVARGGAREGAAPKTTGMPSANQSRSNRAFYQGEEVIVRKREQDQVLIEFPDGDTEWVHRSELEWR